MHRRCNFRMRLNSRIMVYGEKVVLLPYKRHMVIKYHEWMRSPELLQLTASEPLTIEEEYEMQRKWLEDDDKCTFIILDLESYEKTKDDVGSMIGDTNLFFVTSENSLRTAEAEIMIAETSARRKHKGLEAMVLMLIYGVEELKVEQYQVKIGVSNSASMQMFKKLGFVEVSRSHIFQEVTMMRIADEQWLCWLHQQTKMKICPYDSE